MDTNILKRLLSWRGSAAALALLAIAIAGVTWLLLLPESGERKRIRAAEFFTEVTATLKQRAPAAGPITTSKLIAEGIIPAAMVTDGKVMNSWGGATTVAEVPLYGVRNGGFAITSSKVPRDACSALVASLESHYDVVLVGWTKLKDVQDGTKFSPDAALGACNNESNEVTLSASRPL